MHKPFVHIRSAALLCAGLVALAAQAVEMYRWVDEHGVVNISDVMPDKYKKTAVRVDSSQFELTEAQRRDAAVRAAALASEAAAARPASQAARPAGPARSLNAARAASASASAAADDCPTLLRRYKEAQDCFQAGPKIVGGAVNPGLSPQCPVLVDPSPQCGLRDLSGK